MIAKVTTIEWSGARSVNLAKLLESTTGQAQVKAAANARKAAERARKRAAGLVKLELWLPPALHVKVRQYAAKKQGPPKRPRTRQPKPAG